MPRVSCFLKYIIAYSAHAVVTLDLSEDISLKSLSGYIHLKSASNFDFDASPLPIFSNISGLDYKVFSQELQLNGKSFGGRLNWVAGLYYYNEKLDNRGVNGVANIAVGVPQAETPVVQKTTNIAGYADVTYKASDKLSVLGGFRYSNDRLSGVSLAPLNGNVGDPLIVFDSLKASFSSATGRLGAQYQWTPSIMTYVTASQGFRAGGLNQLQDGTLQKFKPEDSTSFECGARLSFFDRRLRFNPTVFYTLWKNIQLNRAQAAPPPFGILNIVDNAAKAHTYGIELESDAAVSQSLHLFAHLATLEAKYDDILGTGAINKNSRFQRAPKFSYGFGASYTREIAHEAKVNATVNWSAQSSQSSTATDNDTLTIPAYGIANMRVEYITAKDRFTLGLGVSNLLDRVYFVGGSDYSVTSGTSRYDLGRPREFSVTGKLRF
jgi:iron complex outermembrane receptor protein